MKAILRTLGENYTYGEFLNILEMKKKTFNPAQLSGIQQRLDLLMSFTLPKKKGASKTTPKSRFCEGRITIIDLSDPFIDPSSACGLFEILLRLFERADVSTGKVLVVDEAHKVLTVLLVVPLTPIMLRTVSFREQSRIGTYKGAVDSHPSAETYGDESHSEYARYVTSVSV